ncbi:hypothetical protein PAT3040_05602 [Paenibacillus agaridevorans]|uniref:DUF4085 domain-containing protein n=2 Tax=Paenibacillus agaridevorans TaxID=171404 RepID=A0A2R5EVV9_9BACL|nr:hypothetical protein PAT3040_05602 [Paenibacillus agaridevorans]
MIMRYFTAELYEKMQVRGSLVFHETLEDHEEDLRWYAEQNRDYDAIARDNYLMLEPYFNRYMPKVVREAVDRGEGDLLRSSWPSPAFRSLLEGWAQSLEKEWRAACETYREYYRTIESRLPPEMESLVRLHDAKVLQVTVTDGGSSIDLLLDTGGSMLSASEALLRFNGVTRFDLPDDLVGNWWLYEELELPAGGIARDGAGETGFQIRALLSSPRGYLAMNELSITAESVDVVLTA